jgi:hypothetical protein
MDAPTSSYTTAGIVLRVSGALKPLHHNKVETPSVGNEATYCFYISNKLNDRYEENVAACRHIAGQQPRDKEIYKSHCLVTPSQTNMLPWKRLNYNDEEWCFLCGP